MRVLKIWTAALPVSFILACSADKNPPPPPVKTVFDPMTQQLDKARETQKTVDENAAQTRAAVDAQERGDRQESPDSRP